MMVGFCVLRMKRSKGVDDRGKGWVVGSGCGCWMWK